MSSRFDTSYQSKPLLLVTTESVNVPFEGMLDTAQHLANNAIVTHQQQQQQQSTADSTARSGGATKKPLHYTVQHSSSSSSSSAMSSAAAAVTVADADLPQFVAAISGDVQAEMQRAARMTMTTTMAMTTHRSRGASAAEQHRDMLSLAVQLQLYAPVPCS